MIQSKEEQGFVYPLAEEKVTECPVLVSTGASVIIPTFNEKDNISTIVNRCLEVLDGRPFEIIVVDDDSPDETWKVARSAFDTNTSVRVIRRRTDRGLATAVKRGFTEAKYDVCTVIDADLQHPPDSILDLLQAVDDGADIAVGSRHVEGGGIEEWSRFRTAVSSGAGLLTDLLVPESRQVSDPMSGFFAVHTDVLAGANLDPTGYKILLEVLTKCDYDKVVEVPYTFQKREHGESKLTAMEYRHFIEHSVELAVTSRGFDRFVSPKKALRMAEFGTVGGFGVIVNMAVFMAILGSGFDHMVAGSLAFIAAVNSNFIGNWLLTFNDVESGLFSSWGKFHLVSVTGFILYSVFLTISIESLLLPAFTANLLAIAGSSVFNFVGAENIAFATEV